MAASPTCRPGLKATVLIDDDDRYDGLPLFEVVLKVAWDQGVAMAVATKGAAGFGRRHVVHTIDIEALASRLPVTIECVGEPEPVRRLVDRLSGMAFGGVVEVQPTTLVGGRTAAPGVGGS